MPMEKNKVQKYCNKCLVMMMLCTTLSLVEKLASKIRHKHVSELHVIIVRKTSVCEYESPLHLAGAAGENTVPCWPHLHDCIRRSEHNMGH